MPRVYMPRPAENLADERQLACIESNGVLSIVDTNELDSILDNVDSDTIRIYTLTSILDATEVESNDDGDDYDDDDDSSSSEIESLKASIDTLVDVLKTKLN